MRRIIISDDRCQRSIRTTEKVQKGKKGTMGLKMITNIKCLENNYSVPLFVKHFLKAKLRRKVDENNS